MFLTFYLIFTSVIYALYRLLTFLSLNNPVNIGLDKILSGPIFECT
jgi:hypothetical protein